MNYYSILGLTTSASLTDIKQAYRKLAIKYHPDKGGDSFQFQQINQAYEQLKAIHTRPNKNQDISLTTTIELVDVLLSKDVYIEYKLSSNNIESIMLTIPKGIEHNTVLCFTQLGDDANPTIPRGDLYIRVQISPNKIWKREHNNLITKIQVNVFDLILGSVIIVQTIDNKELLLNIPKGTQSGTTFSFKDQGLLDIKTKQFGTLYISIEAIIPVIEDTIFLTKLSNLLTEV